MPATKSSLPAEYLADTGRHGYLVCAYYTDGYRNEVTGLDASLEAFGLDRFLKHFDSRGYWEANTRIKPEFLRDCLWRFPGRDVLYLDADSVVRAPLALFEHFEADIGVFKTEGDELSHRHLTGTIYLKNTAATQRFLNEWVAAQASGLLRVDQDSFDAAIAANSELRVQGLPSSYVKIFDRGEEPAVIEHFQASRKRVKLARALKRTRNSLIALLLLGGIAYWIAGLLKR